MRQRIEFVDLAKGVCILLVIAGHTGLRFYFPGLDAIRMPLYFILSGLFFKDYGGLKNLLKKKFNKILFPFLFFYIGSYLFFYVCQYLLPELIQSEATGILDVFTQRQYFNGPIWFLLSLFWANVMYCIISLTLKSEWLKAGVVVAIGFIGAQLGMTGVFLPCMLDASMTALPFFYFGSILKRWPLLYPNRLDRWNVLLAFALYGVVLLSVRAFGDVRLSLHNNMVIGNYALILIVSTCGVMAVLLLCKSIRTLPFVAFFGRYSIIPLCTHHLVYRPLKLAVDDSVPYGDVLVVVLTILICAGLIPICRRLIPWAVAQKDILK